MRRVHGWSFRLQQESHRSDLALFVTLTYDNDHVPITKKKFMTLSKKDVQLFFKRLRKLAWLQNPKAPKIKYYAAGEYGPKTFRPHYHLIIFNADYELIEQAWTLGDIHYGHLSAASAAYTLKYISKDSTLKYFPGDDRQKEFSLMSKRLGDNYLTPEVIAWHRKLVTQEVLNPLTGELVQHQTPNLERYNLTVPGGYKIAIPRYYKNKIWTPLESQYIGSQFQTLQEQDYALKSQQEKFDIDKKYDELREYYHLKNRDERETSI